MITVINIDKAEIVKKAWGEEVILHNGNDYCGKLLRFKKDAKFSMHFHSKKTETWYVNKGEFELHIIETTDASKYYKIIKTGDIVHIEPNSPHQLVALEEGEIFEVSTPHYDDDSYRIIKGDSQK